MLIGAHSTMASARLVARNGRSFLATFGLGEEGDREGGDRRGVDGDRERQQGGELQRQHAEHPHTDREDRIAPPGRPPAGAGDGHAGND